MDRYYHYFSYSSKNVHVHAIIYTRIGSGWASPVRHSTGLVSRGMGLTVIWLATAREGRSEPPRGRLRVTPVGTERQKVGLGWVIIRFDSNN